MPLYESVNGVARKVVKMYDEVNGVAREVIKSYDSVNGVARLYHSSGIALGELDVGSSVFLTMGTQNKEFCIIHQGLPSSKYDESCNGTWLFTKDIYDMRAWDEGGVNNYRNSTIHTYLNEDIFNLFASNIQSLIKQVKIPYVRNFSDGTKSLFTGSSGLQTKVFLLSAQELGHSSSGLIQGEGTTLSYFTDSSNALYEETAVWTRTPTKDKNTTAYIIKNGICASTGVTSAYGFQPTIILPFDTKVDGNFNILT